MCINAIAHRRSCKLKRVLWVFQRNKCLLSNSVKLRNYVKYSFSKFSCSVNMKNVKHYVSDSRLFVYFIILYIMPTSFMTLPSQNRLKEICTTIIEGYKFHHSSPFISMRFQKRVNNRRKIWTVFCLAEILLLKTNYY